MAQFLVACRSIPQLRLPFPWPITIGRWPSGILKTRRLAGAARERIEHRHGDGLIQAGPENAHVSFRRIVVRSVTIEG